MPNDDEHNPETSNANVNVNVNMNNDEEPTTGDSNPPDNDNNDQPQFNHPDDESLPDDPPQHEMLIDPHHMPPNNYQRPKQFILLHYTPFSLLISTILLWYAFRTRSGQFYPAMHYLTTSKLSYCVFFNAIVSSCVSLFYIITGVFLGGLRSSERENVTEQMRWSCTETCLALTMFREELNVDIVSMFLTLIFIKCLHWIADARCKHLIQTEEAVFVDQGSKVVILPRSHKKFVLFLNLLWMADVFGVGYCVSKCVEDGPSVLLLFGFEGVVLGLIAGNSLNLYALHVMDGAIGVSVSLVKGARMKVFMERFAAVWREKKFTLTLTLELFTQTGKFLSYLLFFFLVLTYYGMPVNIFRDLYISYQELKQKILQLTSYRRLSKLMFTNFHTCETEEELEEAGGVCIICRDAMTAQDGAKKLPGCGHVFHPYCLKGWLMQQQSCPTCRRNIDKAVRDQNMERQRQELDQQQQQQREIIPPEDVTNTVTPPLVTTTENLTPSGTAAPAPPESDASESKLFPCLYKVNAPTGVSVYTSESCRTIIRTVAQNKIIVCTDMMWWREKDEKKGGVMLCMPDGWVTDDDMFRLFPVPALIAKEKNNGITCTIIGNPNKEVQVTE